MRRLLALLSAAALACGAACDTRPCVERGTTQSYDGSASYSGQTAAPKGTSLPLEGAVSTTLAVDDFSNANSCSGNTVEFTMRMPGCVLWATSDDADGGTASIEDGQTCPLPTAEGIATVQLQDGVLIAGGDPVTLELAGTVVSLGDAGVDGGYLQWTFTGQ